MNYFPNLTAGTILAAMSAAVFAHATLEQDTAEAGSYYVGTINISHGCEGSPTTAVRVRIPEGVMQSKPMPKTGWQLETVKESLEEPYEWYGRSISEEIRELNWRGGSLPDRFFDQFKFQAKLPDTPGETLYFRVVQECEDGIHRWIEVPQPGEEDYDYREPAPSLRLVPAQGDDDRAMSK